MPTGVAEGDGADREAVERGRSRRLGARLSERSHGEPEKGGAPDELVDPSGGRHTGHDRPGIRGIGVALEPGGGGGVVLWPGERHRHPPVPRPQQSRRTRAADVPATPEPQQDGALSE